MDRAGQAMRAVRIDTCFRFHDTYIFSFRQGRQYIHKRSVNSVVLEMSLGFVNRTEHHRRL